MTTVYEVVAYYQERRQREALALATRKGHLEAFAHAHGLQVARSFSGPEGSDAFTQAVALSRALGSLLLVTTDSGDEQDIRLMMNLTRLGVHFMAVRIEKTTVTPWPDARH